MTDTPTVQSWLRDAYNDAISVYDYGDYVRLTNGSAAHYVDVYPHDGSFVLEGERYGETINESCDATQDALLDRLSHCL